MCQLFQLLQTNVEPCGVLTGSRRFGRGYGMKVNRVVWRHEDTLYSYMTPDALKRFPGDNVSAAAMCEEYAKACDPVKNNIDHARNPFYVKLNPKSFLSKLRDDLGFFTVVGEEGDEPGPGIRRIDVEVSVLRRFTNSAPGTDDKDVSFSHHLVDAAIAAGAAYMLVIHDEWYPKADPALSEYRGVILIDSAVFLEYVDHTVFTNIEDGQTEIGFRLGYSLGDLNSLVMQVDFEPFSNKILTAPEPTCPDFVILEPHLKFEKGYNVCIKDQTNDEIILNMIYNVSPTAPLGSHIGAPLLGLRGPYKRKAADE